jgi:hypothetical protein
MSKFRTVIYWIGFGLLWVLLSVAGLLVDRVLFRGTFLASGIVTVIESWIGTEGWALRVSVILSSGILGLIDGLLLGMFQWIAIRRLIKGAYGWILATSLGVSLGLMTFWSLMILLVPGRLPAGSDLDRAFWLGLLDSLITGITLGFAQYLVMRRRVRNVRWWIPTMMATMMVTWVVRWFVNPGASFFVFGTMSGVVIAILGALGAELSEDPLDKLRPVNSPIPASQHES